MPASSTCPLTLASDDHRRRIISTGELTVVAQQVSSGQVENASLQWATRVAVHMGGWQNYMRVDGNAAGAPRQGRHYASLSHYLGAVGMPGVTAYYGPAENLPTPSRRNRVRDRCQLGAVGSAGGRAGQGARLPGGRHRRCKDNAITRSTSWVLIYVFTTKSILTVRP